MQPTFTTTITKAKVTKVKQKRNRVSLVCLNCKEKKIKCNRESPCSSCIKAFTTSTCIYNYSKNLNDNKFTIESIDNKKTPKLINLLNNEDSKSLLKASTPSVSTSDTVAIPFKVIVSNSILDQKFDLNPEYVVFCKPSRTQIRPFELSINLNQSPLFSHMVSSFKSLLNNERKNWKLKNFNKNFQLVHINTHTSNTEIEMSKLNKLIECSIRNNYYSILERLNYFQNNLNNVLFNSYIPMGVVQLIFQHYFIMKPNGVIFKQPEKKFEYSFIALITSLVELTNIFTKHEKINFNFPLPCKDNEFNEITITLINASNYRRKASIFNIYTLLNLRLTLMVYGDAQSGGVVEQNSYPIFQTVVNMCTELGININQDKIKYMDSLPLDTSTKYNELLFCKEIPTNSYKLLWNYILTLDCHYFISLYSPPLIDDRYSYGYYDSLISKYNSIEKFIKLIKELSLVILGLKQVSLNDIIKKIQKVEELFFKLGSFNSFLLMEKSEDNWQFLNIKFSLLKLLLSLNLHIWSILSEPNLEKFFPTGILEDQNNKKAIIFLKEDLTAKCKLLYFIGLTAILNMSQSNFSNKFLLYNREVFSTWLGVRSMIFLDIIVNADHEKRTMNKSPNENDNNEDDKFMLPTTPVFNIEDLENSLLNFSTNKNSKTLLLVNEASKPKLLAAFLTTVYESTISLPILVTDYKFFVMTKIFLINIYFLYCYLKSNEKNFQLTENFNKLNNLSKKVFKKYLQEGASSHISTEQVMNDIDHENKIEKSNNILQDQNSIHLDKSNDDNKQDNFNSLLTPINDDDLLLNFLDINNLNDMYNEVNQYFNPIEPVVHN